MSGTNTCGPFNEGGLFTKPDGTQVEARGPFGPAFDGITYQKTIGASGYNAMELTLKHSSRYAEFLAAYTYSKSIDNSSSLSEEVNPLDPGISEPFLPSMCAINFVFSYNAPLPFAELTGRRNRWTQDWRFSGLRGSGSGCRLRSTTMTIILIDWLHAERYQQQWRRHAQHRQGNLW